MEKLIKVNVLYTGDPNYEVECPTSTIIMTDWIYIVLPEVGLLIHKSHLLHNFMKLSNCNNEHKHTGWHINRPILILKNRGKGHFH